MNINKKFKDINLLSESDLQRMYKIMGDVQKILDYYNIKWWCIGGTLLGCIRHNAIIPWDDDIDISIHINNKQKLDSLKDEFKKNGYVLHETHPAFKIYPIDGVTCGDTPYKWPYIDIFTVVEKNNKLMFTSVVKSLHPPYLTLDDTEEYFCEYLFPHEIEKLLMYKFGPLKVPIPHIYDRTLKNTYGINYLINCSTPIFSAKTESKQKKIINFTIDEFNKFNS